MLSSSIIPHYPVTEQPKKTNPLRILFANVSADGHFYPLTSLAVHLKNAGHDVRWYSSGSYEKRIRSYGIPHYEYQKALDVTAENQNIIFPERQQINGQIAKLKFDLENYFIRRAPEFYEDIKTINETFPFDVFVADVAFTGIPFVRDLLKKKVISIGVLPLMESSKQTPPYGLGLAPSHTFLSGIRDAFLRFASDNLIFKKPTLSYHRLLKQYGIPVPEGNLFDTILRKSDFVLQSGTPGFEYPRKDMSENIRFIGPLLPHSAGTQQKFSFTYKQAKYKKIILVTQGTMERDPAKIIVPTLEAFKDSEYLVIATTGGSQTESLRQRYSSVNIIIEDFISFDDIMPYADVFVSNGGYGGVLLAIKHQLPLVLAGVHEGKNEINARAGYFQLGINLKTETPSASQVKNSIEKVLSTPAYKSNITRLNKEMSLYNPQQLCENYIQAAFRKTYSALSS